MKRFSVYMRKTPHAIRPCLIISPDELNFSLPYVMIIPITTTRRALPFRIPVLLKGKNSYLMLDKIQTVSKSDLIDKIGQLPEKNQEKICSLLQKMFEL